MNGMVKFAMAGLAMAGMLACGGGGEKRETGPAVKVTAVAASVQKLPSSEVFVGNIRSRQAMMISTKMMGRVLRIAVEEGQAVKRGQLLVEVDAAEAKSGFDQASAGLSAADVAVRNMEKDHERFQRLYEQKAVTKHQLEQVEMGLAAAKAQQAQAKAGVDLSKTLLSYGAIAAPDDGIITKKWMDAGNLAYPGAPILTLENPRDLELSVAVPEEKARKLARGQRASVTVDSLGNTFEAEVTAVVGAADPMTRTSTVKLSVPQDEDLAPGLFARVRFEAFAQEGLAVPADALTSEGQMDGVFVADGGVARLRWIQAGPRPDSKEAASAAMVQVLSGLKEGEKVIHPVPPGLRDGQPVEDQP